MKRCLGSGRISPPAGFKPAIPGSHDPKSGALIAWLCRRFGSVDGSLSSGKVSSFL